MLLRPNQGFQYSREPTTAKKKQYMRDNTPPLKPKLMFSCMYYECHTEPQTELVFKKQQIFMPKQNPFVTPEKIKNARRTDGDDEGGIKFKIEESYNQSDQSDKLLVTPIKEGYPVQNEQCVCFSCLSVKLTTNACCHLF